jgi:TPR repeat protein
MKGIIMLAIAIGAYLIMNKLNDARKSKAYKDYYAQKRSKFPWLDNWIKETNIDPAVERVSEVKLQNIAGGIFILIVIAIIFILLPSWQVYKVSFPVQIVFLALPLLVSYFWVRSKAKKPGDLGDDYGAESGLMLECPSCHCPHSYVMPQKEVFIDGDDGSSTTTTTTTKTRYGDDSTAAGALFSGTKTDTKTTYKETHNYYGREFKDFKCLNCGHHTERNKFERSWGENPPRNGMHYYDPPKPAWDYAEIKNLKEEKSGEEKLRKGQKQQKSADKSYTESRNTSGGTAVKMSIAEMEKSMANGSVEAKRDLVVAYFLGLGVEKDEEKARTISEVEMTNDYKWGLRDTLGDKGYEAFASKNYDIAFPLLQKATELNELYSPLYLAKCYHFGYGVAPNKKKAYELYQKYLQKNPDNKDAQKALKELKKELK